mmetsp:Transcript_31729/g.47131  ORF Transcript_31729/g.47131 Transcript_31729/m.47131 type:complete len:127 (-) Transcript_31729:275-655(-)
MMMTPNKRFIALLMVLLFLSVSLDTCQARLNEKVKSASRPVDDRLVAPRTTRNQQRSHLRSASHGNFEVFRQQQQEPSTTTTTNDPKDDENPRTAVVESRPVPEATAAWKKAVEGIEEDKLWVSME